MARILVINPNSSEACSAGISLALDAFRFASGPILDVVTLTEGPPAIYSWRDWHAVVEPMCRLVEKSDADVFVVACASDPGIEAVRTATSRPVLGIFRSAVAAAVARAERFGVIAIVESSKARHRMALRAMGLEDRLAGEVALNVSMDTLLDPDAARAALVGARAGGDGGGDDYSGLHGHGTSSDRHSGRGRFAGDRARSSGGRVGVDSGDGVAVTVAPSGCRGGRTAEFVGCWCWRTASLISAG
jgi:allantoin racemase